MSTPEPDSRTGRPTLLDHWRTRAAAERRRAGAQREFNHLQRDMRHRLRGVRREGQTAATVLRSRLAETAVRGLSRLLDRTAGPEKR
jgi:hypothetical protein